MDNSIVKKELRAIKRFYHLGRAIGWTLSGIVWFVFFLGIASLIKFLFLYLTG